MITLALAPLAVFLNPPVLPQPVPPPLAAPQPAPQAASEPAPDPIGTDQSPGSAPPPPVVPGRLADRYYDPAAMAAAEMAMMAHHSAPRYSAARLDLAEWHSGGAGGSYRWEGQAWTGDLNRLMLQTRGEGALRGALDRAEIEIGYARAISPWWNLEAGLRQDAGATPARTHLMLAAEGLAPYRFDIRAAAYLSDRGQATARIEAAFDQRITRRSVVQPRAEFNLSAQAMPAQRQGAGLTTAEIGLRLRYEFTRKFAPYIGVEWAWAAGRTAGYRREEGQTTASTALVLGVKSWF